MYEREIIGKMINIIKEERQRCLDTCCVKCALSDVDDCNYRMQAIALYNEICRTLDRRIRKLEIDIANDEEKIRRKMAREILNATTIHGRRYIRKYLKERYDL